MTVAELCKRLRELEDQGFAHSDVYFFTHKARINHVQIDRIGVDSENDILLESDH